MKIEASHISKNFLRKELFSNFSYVFESPSQYGIIGNNGSGKSTLLKILSGFLSPNKGTIVFSSNETVIAPEDVFKHIAYCAPYIDLIEGFTLREQIEFHFNFKKFMPNLSAELLIDELKIPENKVIETFSSGMKQRLKLMLNIGSQSDLLILDEPTSFLDKSGIDWFHQILNTYSGKKLIIIASNEKNDLVSCKEMINIENYIHS